MNYSPYYFTASYTFDSRSGLPLRVDNGTNSTLILYGQAAIGEYAVQTAEWHYYLGDAQLSVRQLVDIAGTVTQAQTYAPYGVLLNQVGDGGGLFGYKGGQSSSNGLWYFGNGYFDPNTGQFISANGDAASPLATANAIGFFLAPVLFIGWRRRKGKKRIHPATLLFLGILLAVTLASCGEGGNSENITVTETAPPEGTGTELPGTEIPPVTSTPPPPNPTDNPPPAITPTPTPCPTPDPQSGNWEKVGVFKTSAYYLPVEGDYSTITIAPIPAADWIGLKYLSTTEGRYNNDINMAQTASENFLFDENGVCLQGSGQLLNGRFISCITPRGAPKDQMKFSWAPQGRIENLNPLETVAVCPQSMGGLIPHPNLDNAGNLVGTIPTIKLEGEGIENFFSSNGKDNILDVVDVGQGLCPQSNDWNKFLIDIYIGTGSAAFDSYYLDAINAGDMTVYIKR